MPSFNASSTMNSFSGGLKTEFTGLNFPENACTDMLNVVPTIVGDTTRRLGIDYETNFTTHAASTVSVAKTTYKWNNAGGDGSTQIVVVQSGNTLYFFVSSLATVASPLSTHLLGTIITLSNFSAGSNAGDISLNECQYTDGNGILFVFHALCDPFYVTYSNGQLTSTRINIQVRDLDGLNEGSLPNLRPSFLSTEHYYNLLNQGWVQGASNWTTTTSYPGGPFGSGVAGAYGFTVAAGQTAISGGDTVTITLANNSGFAPSYYASGVVISYVNTTLTINVTAFNLGPSAAPPGGQVTFMSISSATAGYINTFLAQIGVYPSNADVWWSFKNASNTFAPSTTINQVPLDNAFAPRGHFTFSAFNQNRAALSAQTGITTVTTNTRPRTGAWYAGRVFYAGIDAAFPAQGDVQYYAWSENIYFSQIIENPTQFGNCYQTNDPTAENLFGLLSSDGGVIRIPGTGTIYKLFTIQNGMLVFAANGIWFITGSQGIGFTAVDYTVTKISNVRTISGTSFVDVMGLPYFWNEEGIYTVTPSQQGLGLVVDPITVGTILNFYSEIPLQSKKYVRGTYDPINYELKWVYKTINEVGISDRYNYDGILNLNVYTRAFYPYQVSPVFNGTPNIHGIFYLESPGGSSAPFPTIKFLVSDNNNICFAEEQDESYTDWRTFNNGVGLNFVSTFTTGFSLKGKALYNFYMPYIYIYSRQDTPTSYKIQSIWDYATTGDQTGRWSAQQVITNNKINYGMMFRRHRLRGQGEALQLKFTSVDGQPFDIMGWSMYAIGNTGL